MSDLSVEEEEWIEHTLVDFERQRRISKILSTNWENAIPKGNNYASDMYRLKLKVVLYSGEVEERSFVYKQLPTTPHRRIGMKSTGFFNKEARVYQELMPTLEAIRKTKEVDGELLSPECYGIKKGCEGFLLQDLSTLGFKMGDRMKGLDLDHAELLVKSLAKFHALGAIAIERFDVNASEYENYFLSKSEDISATVMGSSFDDLAATLENKWKGEWVEYADRLRKFKQSIGSKLAESYKKDLTKFYTICHGDCWLNNVLFKYGPDGKPNSLRFVDFQMSSYNRPGFDVHYFFQTSLEVGIMKRKHELLQKYYDSLIANLEHFGYGSKMPSFEDIKEGFDKASVFAFAIAIAFRPLLMCPSENAPDMEEISKSYVEQRPVSMSRFDYDGEDFIKTLQYTLRESKELGIL